MCLLLNFGQNLAFSWDVWVWKHKSLFCAAIPFFWEILSIYILAMKHEYLPLTISTVKLDVNGSYFQTRPIGLLDAIGLVASISNFTMFCNMWFIN